MESCECNTHFFNEVIRLLYLTTRPVSLTSIVRRIFEEMHMSQKKGDEIADTAKLAEYLNRYLRSVFVKEEENDTTPLFAYRTNHYCNDDANLVFS